MWLFDGNEQINPIHDQDSMMIGCSYRQLMDTCIANATYGKGLKNNPNYTVEKALEDTLKEHIDMIVRETKEEFKLCLPKMAEELRTYYNDQIAENHT